MATRDPQSTEDDDQVKLEMPTLQSNTEDDVEVKIKPRQNTNDEARLDIDEPPPKEIRPGQATIRGPRTGQNQTHERQSLLGNKPDNRFTRNKGTISQCVTVTIAFSISLAILISIATVLGVKNSIYAQGNSVGKVLVGNEDAVLLLEYDPNIIGTVKLNAPNSQGTIHIYNSTCESLQNETNYLNETLRTLNITSNQETYPLEPLYLLEGSLLQYNFNVTLEDTPKMSQTSCAVDMNIFNNYLQYVAFRNDPTSVLPPVQHCLTNGQSNYTVEAVNTDYYFQVVHILPDFFSRVRTIAYKVHGYTFYYNTAGQPISCLFVPGLEPSCEVSGTTKQNSCILAEALDDSFTEVTHDSSLTSHLAGEYIGLLLGSILLGVVTLGTCYCLIYAVYVCSLLLCCPQVIL